MNPAELVLLGVALVGSVVAFGSYLAKTSEERSRRRRQEMGLKNADRHLRALTEEVCAICDQPTQAEVDIFDKKTNTWWHQKCWRESVEEGPL